ncbi:hypothetical protein M9980_00550 [Sphingomonas donggukensis]|uniref:HTH araC/xylS-type domain-containing protein n=1 Tax=Sphingomonas donggukensis TaxID=2949093 RepID=A0ABY4TZL6_9SPHN|nr:hypothetical protein [Sphingomonas donggukensis]URW75763.1 hypothetical protein M9980_00550 [Sphingomonas donggukensis]
MDRHSFVAGTSPYDAPDMPAGTRVRYFAPAPALAGSITAYNAYGAIDAAPRVDPFLPMMMMVNILIDAGPVSVRIRNHRYDDVPAVALYGAMTRPLVATTQGGIMIGAGISPVGWARLSRRSAVDFHNRVAPLGGLFGPHWGERVRADLAAAKDDADIPAILDRHFAPLLDTPHPYEPVIAGLGAAIANDAEVDIVTIAARLGVTTAALRRIAHSYFGMPPKLLLRRARFFRSFLREPGLVGGNGPRTIEPAYYDSSHYLRDAGSFLGTTPRRFLKQPADFLRGSLASRALTLGVAAQVLHHVDPAAH